MAIDFHALYPVLMEGNEVILIYNPFIGQFVLIKWEQKSPVDILFSVSEMHWC